ncbi:MAG: tRNA (adenosine(37)-N6)-threonylcarbamoyltransferase complex ATPase subunit type 1 TsaE [Planctomycetota bacterium]|nr:tRNA (adenosine(37)-N6)-threonylcarbamoyltransferase complex ATPase subunit type 1 TsaE [Planctomycetota bacterium]
MKHLQSHERVLGDPDTTEAYGFQLGSGCEGGERIALIGELGAGKTTLMRGFARGMGVDSSEVTSPTFTLLAVHEPTNSGLQLVHGDAYRLGSREELDAVGWEEYMADPHSVVVLEWPQRVEGALGSDPITIEIMHDAPDSTGTIGRLVRCTVPESVAARSTRSCPTCSQAVPAGGEFFPFCCSRCRLADLGSWFSGAYTLSREIEEDDLYDPDLR